MSTDDKLTAAASALLAEIAADDWGQVAVSYYDTGRLLAIAPWLAGHEDRLDFVHRTQARDGTWGGRDGYEIVPTMSVTAAMFAELARTTCRGQRQRLARTLLRAVDALQRRLHRHAIVPDTIGVELILPALLAELRQRAEAVAGDPLLVDLPSDAVAQLQLPDEFDDRLLAAAHARLAAHQLPQRAWACLEIFGSAAVAAPTVRPEMGAVAGSAAATAAWLGGSSGDAEAVAFLERLQARGSGPVPGVTPITYFEPAWVLNSLAMSGLVPKVPTALLQRLEEGVTAEGVPAAPGLPPDADDTAAALSALLRHGHLPNPDCLLGFRTDGYFRCFLDERNPSVSTNAHVLETFALYLTHRPEERSRYAAAADMTARWLLDQQLPDGSWWDKWHASPYYATACCVTALLLHEPSAARAAIDRAVRWVLDTQQPDGCWGRWDGSVEETAYAVLVLTKAARGSEATQAIARGAAYLADPPATGKLTALWHAKDLYTPVAVVRAAQLGALRLAEPAAIPRPRTPSEPYTHPRIG